MCHTQTGKTNVAMLALAAHFRDVGLIGSGERRSMDTGNKVVYIAPMKALAQEVVEKVSEKKKTYQMPIILQGRLDL
jgi:activating signal cointegrator complex subunit 3